jgi:hypothetical protein
VLITAHVAGVPVEELVPWVVPTLGALLWNVRISLRRYRPARQDDIRRGTGTVDDCDCAQARCDADETRSVRATDKSTSAHRPNGR